jgi:hypothetical protein
MTSGQIALASQEALPSAAPVYRRLVRQWWRWKSDEAWLAADHVLIVRTRFFNERYLRLYWADIAALLLFPAAQNVGLMLIGEVICLLAAPALGLFATGSSVHASVTTVVAFPTGPRIAGVVMSAVTAVLYAVWRFTRRRWSVQVMTLTGQAVIPLAITRSRAARYVDQLRQSVETAQVQLEAPRPPIKLPVKNPERLPALVDDAPKPSILLGANEPGKRPIVALHATVFLLGIMASALSFLAVGSAWYPLFIFSAVIFYLALPALFFLQQDPGFPFAVRSAAVLNMVMAAGALSGFITAWGLTGIAPWLGTAAQQLGHVANLLRLICCLFGIMTLWKYRIDKDDLPLPRQHETLT